MTRQHSIYYIAALPMLLLLLVVVVALAGTATIPHSFVPGEVADANQVNENFNAVKVAIDDNDSRLVAAESPTRPGTMLAHCALGTNGNHTNPWTSTGANIITSKRGTGDFLFEVEGVTIAISQHMVIANVTSLTASHSVTIGAAESVGNDNALRIRIWDAAGAPADAGLRIAVFNP